MLSIRRAIGLALYYGLARYLPVSFRFQPFGTISKHVRGWICRGIFRHTGKETNIERGAHFGSGVEIEIGDHSGLGVNCQVPPNLKMGADVMMGPDVLILGQNHDFADPEVPMRLQGAARAEPVVIEANVWIGARVIVLPGVRIGTGAVIGAGSVVTKDVPPFTVCAGNPARVLRERKASVKSKGA